MTVRKFFLFYKQKPLEYNELQRLHSSYTIPAYSLTRVFDDFLRISTEYAARRIFAENDVLSIEKHFNRITVINSECAAHLDGENDSSELVNFPDDSCTFHIVMNTYTYKPQRVCSRQISFGLENGKLHDIHFVGGCNGNLNAISKLLEGQEANQAIRILKGNDCGGRGTSCADQLVRAVEEALRLEQST